LPRTGKHPLKLSKTASPGAMHQPITITTVVHIPMLAGYWAESLKVLSVFFESLFASTCQSFDLMVFDNASCPDVQDHLLSLQRAGKIQYLTLSTHNLKKLGAMDFLFANAPGDFVAFADSDVYFLPGWLEECQAVLEAFPEAGQVTALPTIDKRTQYIQNTLLGLESDPGLAIERGQLIPESCIEAHRLSIGREKEEYLRNAGSGEDIRITRNGVSAYVSAQDFQFVTRREVIRQVLPLEVRNAGEYYDPIYSPVFEAKVDEGGWWRLSTTLYLVHHMGNQLPDLRSELAAVANIPNISQPAPVNVGGKVHSIWRKRILRSRPVRGLLKRMYTWAYSMLFERS
jgi:hypothetical protein